MVFRGGNGGVPLQFYRNTQDINHERRKERVGMQSERQWLLGGNLLTSLSIALGYPLTATLQTSTEFPS